VVEDHRFGLIAGRYQLRDQIGHGGMGRVWLARDEMLDRDVAIKEVATPPQMSPEEDEYLRALILREAKAAGRISHPNVVKVHDVIQTEQWPLLVMEYVPSVNLQRTVHERGPLPPAEVARIGLALLEALVAAHDAGVLHRDVKPDNVLLCDDGRVVLGDFGLATLDLGGKVTHIGALGTPQYVAPERARYGTSSPETDLWSLGATLYAAVEGRSPYGRDSVLETLSALAIDDPDPMQLAGPLEPVLAGLLRRDPAERTRPELLAQQLQRIAAGVAVEEPPAPPPTPKAEPVRKPGRRKRTILAGAGTVAALVTAGVVLTSGERGSWTPFAGSPRERPPIAMGIPGCETPPAQTSPLPQTRPTGEFALPEGWVLYSDPVGFSAAMPQHWGYWRSGNNTVCFKDPHASRVIGVMPFRPKAESLNGYREIAQKQVLLKAQATEWEFTYTLRDQKRHAVVVVMPGRTLFWITDDVDFAPSHGLYDVVRTWFDPGGTGPRPLS
jgi:eukaryotic-like serine/threonine-protein kinase